MNFKQIFGVVLMIVSNAVATSAQESLFTIFSDKEAVVRSVLEAQSQRQPQFSPTVRILSTENIRPGKDIVIDNMTFKLVDPITLRNSVTEGRNIEYIMFASFQRSGETVIVRLTTVTARNGCFGGYYRSARYDTYVAKKDGEVWRAEFQYSSTPQPPMKPWGRPFLVESK